jgi:hypothetical protein
MQPGPKSLPAAADDSLPTLARNHAKGAAIYHDVRDAHAGLIDQAREREKLEAERIERVRRAIEARGAKRGRK